LAEHPFTANGEGVRVRVRLAPKASANRVNGFTADADANMVLKASVTAAPVAGKANAALIKMLAGQWKLAKSALTVVRGQSDRNKTLLIRGETKELMKKLTDWASAISTE